MKGTGLFLLLLCGPMILRAQVADDHLYSEVFEVGATHYLEREFTVDTVTWFVLNLDEGVSITLDTNGTMLMLYTYQSELYIASACGYDKGVRAFDRGTNLMVMASTPVGLGPGTHFTVTCPPNAKATFGVPLLR